SGAGAKDGPTLSGERFDCVVKAFFLEKLQLRGGLAAGKDEAGATGQVSRGAHFGGFDAEFMKHRGVRGEIALNSENSNFAFLRHCPQTLAARSQDTENLVQSRKTVTFESRRPSPSRNIPRPGARTNLPSARGEQVFLLELSDVYAAHGLAKLLMRFENGFRILEMRGGFDDGFRARLGIAGLEDAGADKDGLRAKAANESRIGGSGDAAGREIRNGKFAGFGDLTNQIERRAHFLGFVHEFVVAHCGELAHLADDGTHVANGFDDVARTRFAFRANHRGALGNPADRFAEIARAADERDAEIVLPDVIFLVGGRENLGF